MTTTRTVRAAKPGPVTIRTDLPSQNLLVVADERCEVAELTISTTDDEGTSADAVNAAQLDASGDTLSCRLPRTAGAMVIQSGSGSIQINSGGGVFVSGSNFGVVTVGGRRIVSGSDDVFVGGSPIIVTARVPGGSSVRASSTSGDVETRGRLHRVDASSTSGDVEVEAAHEVRVNCTSGDTRVEMLSGQADINAVSGDISIHGPARARAYARTVSGDVRGTGGVQLDASTVSGRVRNR